MLWVPDHLLGAPVLTSAADLASAEAVVRGYKLGLLTTSDYNNICQCETLDDIKLYLVGWPCLRIGRCALV